MQSIMGGTYPGPGITLGPAIAFAYIAASDAARPHGPRMTLSFSLAALELAHPNCSTSPLSYPVCVYPLRTTWNGNGDAKQASSYSCR